MAAEESLQPSDFPVHIEQNKIVKNNGKHVAEAVDPNIAQDLAERLNADEDRREEDRWA